MSRLPPAGASSLPSHTPCAAFTQRTQGNNVTRTSGTVALDAEKHHKHHRKAQQRGESQRPLDAEDGSRNGRGSRLMPPCGKRLHKNHQHRCTHGARDLPRGVRDRRSGRHLIRPAPLPTAPPWLRDTADRDAGCASRTIRCRPIPQPSAPTLPERRIHRFPNW